MDGLLNGALPFAVQMLEEHGEFYPYALGLDDSGEIRMQAAEPGTGENPNSEDVLVLLYDGLGRDRDGLRACAVVSDLKLTTPSTDAICADIEHREGVALRTLLPYSKKRFGRGVSFGDLTATSGEARIWR
jgi:hypothetical protein